MKIIRIILILFITICFTSSCSNDDDNGNSNCKLKKIISDGAPSIITYRNDGKIESIINEVTSVSQLYTYYENIVVSTTYNDGEFNSRTTVTNNSDGLATNVLYEYENNEFYNFVFQYNGLEVSSQTITTSSNPTPLVLNATWTDGNLTQIGNSTIDYYLDKPSKEGDYFHVLQLLSGYQYFKSKNSAKSITANNQIQNFSYSFNSAENITGLAVSEVNSATQILSYEYDCN